MHQCFRPVRLQFTVSFPSTNSTLVVFDVPFAQFKFATPSTLRSQHVAVAMPPQTLAWRDTRVAGWRLVTAAAEVKVRRVERMRVNCMVAVGWLVGWLEELDCFVGGD
jgi:hypothetical protein